MMLETHCVFALVRLPSPNPPCLRRYHPGRHREDALPGLAVVADPGEMHVGRSDEDWVQPVRKHLYFQQRQLLEGIEEQGSVFGRLWTVGEAEGVRVPVGFGVEVVVDCVAVRRVERLVHEDAELPLPLVLSIEDEVAVLLVLWIIRAA